MIIAKNTVSTGVQLSSQCSHLILKATQWDRCCHYDIIEMKKLRPRGNEWVVQGHWKVGEWDSSSESGWVTIAHPASLRKTVGSDIHSLLLVLVAGKTWTLLPQFPIVELDDQRDGLSCSSQVAESGFNPRLNVFISQGCCQGQCRWLGPCKGQFGSLSSRSAGNKDPVYSVEIAQLFFHLQVSVRYTKFL